MSDGKFEDPWAAAPPAESPAGNNVEDPWEIASSPQTFFLIIVENIDETQRRLVHTLVKKKSRNWWHELLDVWVVQGGTITQWSNDMGIIITGSEKDLYLILSLPKESRDRSLAMMLPKTARDWLIEIYNKGKMPERPAPARVAAQPSPKPFDDEPPF